MTDQRIERYGLEAEAKLARFDARQIKQIVDIQAPTDFGKRHIKGAVETNAYPVKSAEERQRLDKVLAEIAATSSDVVIVCPRGGGGAKNTFDYLVSRGVAVERLYILEKGMEGWPYPEMCATGR